MLGSASVCPLADPPFAFACMRVPEFLPARPAPSIASRLPRSEQTHRRHVCRDGVGAQRRACSAGLSRLATSDVFREQRERLGVMLDAAVVVGIDERKAFGIGHEVAEPGERGLRSPRVRRFEQPRPKRRP
eukprot:1481245-Pleurochrysis_carterae.AAC.2